jgi:nicotinamide phosphoribosyltransferase
MIIKILDNLEKNGWSTDNIAFGSGGGLLQKMNRDTQKCAFKCSLAIIDGKEVYVYKDPITDPGKKSKKGYLTLHKNEDGSFITKCDGNHDFENDLLVTVFNNGDLVKEYNFDEIKERSKIN